MYQGCSAPRLTPNRNELPEMIASIDPVGSGFCLTESTDPRYEYMSSLRRRFGEFLHRASVSLRHKGEENTLDAVHILASQSVKPSYNPYLYRSQIRAIRTYLLEYGDSRDR